MQPWNFHTAPAPTEASPGVVTFSFVLKDEKLAAVPVARWRTPCIEVRWLSGTTRSTTSPEAHPGSTVEGHQLGSMPSAYRIQEEPRPVL